MGQVLERKGMPFEAMAVDLDSHTFEGFSAAIGNLDGQNDRIIPGAFAKTIEQRVSAGAVKLLDQHAATNPFRSSSEALWGVVLEADEVKLTNKQRDTLAASANKERKDAPTHGLHTLFKVTRAPAGESLLIKIKEGIQDALSIGYVPHEVAFVAFKTRHRGGGRRKKAKDDDDNVDPRELWLTGRAERQLKELAWWETSAVIWGMNPFALVLPGTVKDLKAFALEAKAEGWLHDGGKQEIREVIEALQTLAPGCPTKAAVDDVLPKVEKLAGMLDELGNEPVKLLLPAVEELYDAFIEGEPDNGAAAAVKFMGYVRGINDATADDIEPEPDPELDSDQKEAIEAMELLARSQALATEIRGDMIEGLADQLDREIMQAAEETPPEGRRTHLPNKEMLEAELASLELMEVEV